VQIHVDLISRVLNFFDGIKPTTPELAEPRSDQLNQFYIVSDDYVSVCIWIFKLQFTNELLYSIFDGLIDFIVCYYWI